MRHLLLLLLCPLLASAVEWSATPIPRKATRANQGPVWLRCYVRVPDNMTVPAEKDLFRDSVTFSFAGVDQPFAVLINGKQIIESAPVGQERKRFKVPKGILEKGVFNSVVIHLKKDGSIEAPPLLAGYFDELPLAGEWEATVQHPTDAELKASANPPALAAFHEKQFRKSITPLSATETMPGQRLSPDASLAEIHPADELIVETLLHEPLVAQPTHLSFDERGRLWISQYRQYPYPAGLKQISRDMFYRAVFDRVPPAPPQHDRGADRITVHTDTNGDGIFDEHKTVLDGLNMANAAVRGHGGIWVMHTPYLMFYPDADGNDIPDGPPEVRLAGFGLEDTHSTANGLIWGPDGWLYGGQGSTTTSRVTRPGVDSANATGIYYEGCMVWRYHPERREYEIFAEGGGNTFGLEFDGEGRLFSGHNGGDTRGWHFVPGGIYLKQGKDPGKFGPPTNPYALGEFMMMKSANPIPRFTHNIVVAEGSALPPSLNGRLLGADPLHRKITVSDLLPAGPTLSTKDTRVALSSDDIAFRPVYLTNAPDGSLYIADFYEEFIAHGQNYQGQIDPTTGRIYRLRAKNAKLASDTNLATRTTDELIATLRHPNRWHRHTAVRLIGERHDPAATEKLRALLAEKQTHPALEALWALFQTKTLDEPSIIAALRHPSPHVRAWTIRLTGDEKEITPAVLAAILTRLDEETDPIVRSQAASTARRVPVTQALKLVGKLISRDADTSDPFIPLLCWWTLESHLAKNRDDVVAVFQQDSKIWSYRMVLDHLANRMATRLASGGTRAEFITLASLFAAANPDGKKSLSQGFEEAFKGRALPPLPDELIAALAQSGNGSLDFRIRRGDASAIAEALQLIADPKRKPAERLRSIRTIGEAKSPTAVTPLLALVKSDPNADVRKASLGALLSFQESIIGDEVASAFAGLPPNAKPAALTLLASRDAWHVHLAGLLQKGALKLTEIPADLTERLRTSTHADLTALLPAMADSAADAGRERIAKLKTIATAGVGNPYEGEKVFEQRCASCHQLFHKGGQIGPNLTAYQRDDLGTMLVSIVTPNAEIREGYENVTITTKDGRTLGGFLADKDAKLVVLRGFDGQDIALAQDEIREMKSAGRSLMPEGLLDGLTDEQIRDFFAYLRIPQPISK